MQKKDEEQSTSVVLIGLMVGIALFGWAFCAAAYATEQQGLHDFGRGSKGTFITNAFVQIPNGVAVMSYVFQNKIWLPIIFGVLEVLALGFGIVMKVVEKKIDGPPQRGRRR